MGAGLPVVVTYGVGIASLIAQYKSGEIVRKDEKELAQAISKILSNPDLAKQLGENGKRLVEAEFSPMKVAEKMLQEYKEITKNH